MKELSAQSFEKEIILHLGITYHTSEDPHASNTGVKMLKSFHVERDALLSDSLPVTLSDVSMYNYRFQFILLTKDITVESGSYVKDIRSRIEEVVKYACKRNLSCVVSNITPSSLHLDIAGK